MPVCLLLTMTLPTGWVVAGGISLVVMLCVILSGLFGPMPRYSIRDAAQMAGNETEEFVALLESLADAKANRTGTLEVLTNGPCFYPAALQAIRAAERSVCVEAYIFQQSEIGHLYLEALVERARAGVAVNVTLDAFGSLGVRRGFFRPLLEAGGKVVWYNRLAWYSLLSVDHRTHREMLVVDGKTGFIGGAGVADQWFKGKNGHPRWRDTMVRLTGETVSNLQATFAENWLAAAGELLAGSAYFPPLERQLPVVGMIINSTPSPGGGTRARALFQLLLASARTSISITTPYFLPNKGLIRELCRAIERGVKLRILVPGLKSDHVLTRSTSRGGYGPLLRAGAEVFEYQPAMIHAKVLVVDALWSVVGSTNFDNRSFGINDEVNLAVRNESFAERLEADTAADIAQSQRVTLKEWEHRPLHERATEFLGWIIERQQ